MYDMLYILYHIDETIIKNKRNNTQNPACECGAFIEGDAEHFYFNAKNSIIRV
jgi:hypothetical protein